MIELDIIMVLLWIYFYAVYTMDKLYREFM